MAHNEEVMREKAKAVGFDKATRTHDFLVLEAFYRPKPVAPVVIKVSGRNGHNKEEVSLKLIHGEWPNLEELRKAFFPGVSGCGGSTLRGAEHAHQTGHVGITIWGCD